MSGLSNEAGGLQILDIKSLLLDLKIDSLKRTYVMMGNLQYVPVDAQRKKQDGESADITTQRVKTAFREDVLKHDKTLCGKCLLLTFHDFVSECVHYDVNNLQMEKGHLHQEMD